MAKYPYYLTRIEKDGTRDINFVMVVSPTTYVEMKDSYDSSGIWKYNTTKDKNTDFMYKERDHNNKLRLIRQYVNITEEEWCRKFIEVMNRVAVGLKFKQINSKEEKINEELNKMFSNLGDVVDSTFDTAKKAHNSIMAKYKSKILRGE